jgi:hypothetical protein
MEQVMKYVGVVIAFEGVENVKNFELGDRMKVDIDLETAKHI